MKPHEKPRERKHIKMSSADATIINTEIMRLSRVRETITQKRAARDALEEEANVSKREETAKRLMSIRRSTIRDLNEANAKRSEILAGIRNIRAKYR